MARKTKQREVNRDAETGRFITKEEAEKNPNTTVTEKIATKKKK